MAAVLVDTDRVGMDTARVYADTWQDVLDVEAHAQRRGSSFEPFGIGAGSHAHVDGGPRPNGVKFLRRSRVMVLAWCDAADDRVCETACGIAKRRDAS